MLYTEPIIRRWSIAFVNENLSPVSVEMIYDPVKPFELTFSFRDGPTWIFSRNLLSAAIVLGHSGDGDVQFVKDDDILLMHLESPEGQCDLKLMLDSVQAFLTESHDAVCPGEENISDQVNDLLDWVLEKG